MSVFFRKKQLWNQTQPQKSLRFKIRNFYTQFLWEVPKGEVKWLTHEVEIPGTLWGDHEKAEETVRQQHLYFLVMWGKVATRVVATVFVVATPFETRRCQLVRSQRTRTRCEAGKNRLKMALIIMVNIHIRSKTGRLFLVHSKTKLGLKSISFAKESNDPHS